MMKRRVREVGESELAEQKALREEYLKYVRASLRGEGVEKK